MEMTALKSTCIDCKKTYIMFVNPTDLADWKEGKLIQEAMPYLTSGQRELLISQVCGTCFDKLFEGNE